MPSPSGYLVNRTLGAAPGVLAWSNADSATAILITSQVTGILPPPLGQLYTQNERPLETLEDGSQILELEGGVIPLYVAIKVRDGREVLGLGFTIPAATRALQTATQ
jgi:hypothetical protein